jgi:ABC-type transport system substrate-binding protein
VLGVEAADEHLVRITFNGEPGLRIWPHSIGTANIMAEHFWSPYVVAARTAGDEAVGSILDPAEAVWHRQREAADAAGAAFTKTAEDITPEEIDSYLADVYNRAVGDLLNNVSGIGEPSGGPMVFTDWDPGISISFEANRRYHRSGDVIRSGEVTYTMGPFVDEHTVTVYGSENEAVLALLAGEVDHAGVRGTSPVVEGLARRHEDVAVIDNTSSRFWYLGFNLRKPPMTDLGFRRALAIVVDRDFLTGELFQGSIPPAWTLLPESNLEYYDPDLAGGIATKYRNMDRFERLEKAVAILDEAGYTWEQKPAVGRNDRGERSIEPGTGIRMPDGNPVPELEIVHFGAGFFEYYWFTAYGLYIEQCLRDLGVPARAQVSRGDYLIERVWPGVGREPTFDMYLLSWRQQTFPIVYEYLNSRNLAEVNDGNNAVGYVNPEYDQLTEQLNRATTVEDARRIVWQLESIIDRDLPYLVLNGLSHTEAYRTRMLYPFTEVLGGTGNHPEFAGLVRIRE